MCTWRRFLCWSIGPTFHHLVCSGESRAAGHSVHGGLPTGRPGHADGRASSGACWQLLALHAGPRPAPAAPPSKGRARGGGGGAAPAAWASGGGSRRCARRPGSGSGCSPAPRSSRTATCGCCAACPCRAGCAHTSSAATAAAPARAAAAPPSQRARGAGRSRPAPALRTHSPIPQAGQGSCSVARPGRRWSSTRDWRVPGARRPAPPQGRRAMHSKRDRRAAHGPPEADEHARRGSPRRPRARASPARAGGRRRGRLIGIHTTSYTMPCT